MAEVKKNVVAPAATEVKKEEVKKTTVVISK